MEPLDPESGRIELLDRLRGVAILGILLVNMPLFFASIHEEMLPQLTHWTGTGDRLVSGALVFFARGKFYSLFSLLFGFGLALQMERLRVRGSAPAPFLVRRLIGLLALGSLHAVLVWFGDILVLYALSGLAAVFLVTVLFSRARPRTIAIGGGVLLLFPTLLVGTIVALLQLVPADQLTAMETITAEARAEALERLETARDVYPTGTFGEILRQRLIQLRVYYQSALFFGTNVLGLFLLGFAAARAGWTARWAKLWPLALAGIPVNLWFAWSHDRIDAFLPSAASVMQIGALTLGGLTFALLYARLIAAIPANIGLHLSAVGRMALSNYLFQSVLLTLVANGYGLGLYGRISPATGLALTLAVFALQLVLSRWWLARFRFGPAEWLWRCWSYGQLQQFRRSRP